MSDAQKAALSGQEQTLEVSLLDRIVEQGKIGTDSAAKAHGKDLIKEILQQVLQGEMTISKNTEAMINARIAKLDHHISLQLNAIMHHPSFQKLEGSWRGLKYLLDQSETGVMLKIKMLNCTKKEMLRDFQRATEFDQSALFKKVYEEEFGVFGGAPFGTLIGDFEFGKGPEDMDLLERVSQVAASAHCPFLSAASAEMYECRSAWKSA